MKKRITKKNFEKFTKVNTHKRRGKSRAVNELRRALRDAEVSYSGIILRDREDLGMRGKAPSRKHRDEIYAAGIFSGSKSGFGFVTLDSGYDRDIFIPEDKTLGALDGDYVEIVYHVFKSYSGEEKTEGRVLKILRYGIVELIGTLAYEPSYMRGRRRMPSYYYVIPDNSKISVRPRIDDPLDAEEGDKVVVKLKRPSDSYFPEGELVSVLGDAMSREANYEAILIDSGIPTDFTAEEERCAEEAAKMPISDDGRVRFTNHTVMTIDGEGAKDLDDAVGVRKLPSGWRLYVHIADVSAYVTEKTPLDRAVMERGTSVYFTDKVIPMLPRCLSNGACSLNEGEEKYAMSAVVTLDNAGEILKTEIYPSVITSVKRGVYSEVNAIFDGTASAALRTKYRRVERALLKMRELYLILAAKAKARGALELETAEAEILLDNDGAPIDVIRRERADAEKMIEQFMLTANEGVATLLTERGIPCVYRVHSDPPEEKLGEFISFAHNLGFDTSLISRDKREPRDFACLLDKAKEQGLGEQVSYSMLRSMSKAEYSEIRGRHFGLGIENYCHFTSPIRRLSDLATHRIIRRVMFENKKPAVYASYAKRAARAATDAEVRAVNAERRIENLYKVLYMSDRLGEEFLGTVSSVTSFGLFVELENTCEGFIPLSDMPGYFLFDEKNLTIHSSDKVYRLADRVRIRLEEADVVRGKLRFSLVE